jgi:hypothetical protein
MTLEIVLGLITAALILVYALLALLRPEKF